LDVSRANPILFAGYAYPEEATVRFGNMTMGISCFRYDSWGVDYKDFIWQTQWQQLKASYPSLAKDGFEPFLAKCFILAEKTLDHNNREVFTMEHLYGLECIAKFCHGAPVVCLY